MKQLNVRRALGERETMISTDHPRKKAAGLLEELLAGAQEERLARITEERYHDPELLDDLLALGHKALIANPDLAGEIASLAVGLGFQLAARENGPLPWTAGPGISLALCLKGQGHRLAGDLWGAEKVAGPMAFLTSDLRGRADYCRFMGLLRWDMGRWDEATAFLHHGHRLYAELEDPSEEAVCLALLGVLHTETGEDKRAAPLLEQSLGGLDSHRHPWLAAGARLALALCAALTRHQDEAQARRMDAAQHYSGAEAHDALLLLREGQVAGAQGESGDALDLLGQALNKLLERRQIAEAALAAVYRGVVLMKLKRDREIDTLLEQVTEAFFEVPDLTALVLETLGGLVGDPGSERTVWFHSWPRFFRRCRCLGFLPHPVPFT